LFFVPQLAATIILENVPKCWLVFLLLYFYERARAASKQVKIKKQENHSIDTQYRWRGFLLLYYACVRVLFTSKPIHELRLDLNVANTVIALTIRVI